MTKLEDPPIVSAALSTQLAALADRCVRHIVSTFLRKPAVCEHCQRESRDLTFYGDNQVTGLRITVGVAVQRAAQAGILDALTARKDAGLPMGYELPKATSVEDPGFLDEDATTRRYARAQNPERWPREIQLERRPTLRPPPIPEAARKPAHAPARAPQTPVLPPLPDLGDE